MKRLFLVFVLLIAVSRYAAAQTKADEAAVQQIPKAFVAAWATRNGHHLAEPMADDVDFVNVGGDWMHGRPDFELYHTRLLAGPVKASTLKVLDVAVRFIQPNMAVLHWTLSIAGDGEEDPTTHANRRGILTMLVQKQGSKCFVAVAQNTNEMPGPSRELDGIKSPMAYPPPDRTTPLWLQFHARGRRPAMIKQNGLVSTCPKIAVNETSFIDKSPTHSSTPD